jgi:hypothetical protein
MPDAGLLVIAPVREDEERSLCEILNRIGTDVRGIHADPHQAHILFLRSRAIHFARFALLSMPAQPSTRRRLLFATDYDGSWTDHVHEIHSLTHRPDEIWGRCEGYTGGANFGNFIRQHSVEPDAYYIAFRGVQLETLRTAMERRERFQRWQADPRAPAIFRPWRDLQDAIDLVRRTASAVAWPLMTLHRAVASAIAILRLMHQCGARPVLSAARRINASLGRVWWIRIINAVVGVESIRKPHSYSEALSQLEPEPTPPGYPQEDAVLQNQLTLVTDVRPEAAERLRAVLGLIDLYGRTLSSPGSLVGISTIHTVRWALIDGNRRLLMVSNYDGTWENYIDEFAEMILSGLDSLWSSSTRYPEAGARDLAALKQFLRHHQVPANVFYSAYPASSVLNLTSDLEFRRWYAWIVRLLAGDKEPN